MISDGARRTIRTVVATALAIVLAFPLLLDASGIPETTPGVGVLLAVSAAVTRLMALPVVDRRLPRWLRAEGSDAKLLDRGRE